MIVICREVDKNSGRIAVYPLDVKVTDDLLHKLSIRAKLNQELRYFVTTKAHFDGLRDVIESNLRKKSVTVTTIARIGGIVEL